MRSASPYSEETAGTPASDTSTLSVRGVHKSYGHHRVLGGADLELPPGCLGGVVGENGSGKSTLLRILAGQLAPDRGTVTYAERLGYCPQNTVLNPSFTVQQHLRFFQVAYDLPNLTLAHELMDLLSFTEYRHHRVGTLSGGTRHKLNLTLALMHDPPLLLLDEPYQGFDWDTYERFWGLAARLRDRGRSVLVVSHTAFDTTRFDRLWRLEQGRTVLVPAGAGERR
ncbi:ABC transporter ATP-binding protein [Nocardiopsis sp. NPDC058631]|uniref:ABC transporter ATP-binding protein n=1 Tax=Nocardiopsis sp. NPDC058631 TaxID=3346566 RepID=UPI00365DF462